MIWLIGSGLMSREYARVLDDMNQQYRVIGRGESSASSFERETGKEVVAGGLGNFLLNEPEPADFAIVSVGIETLSTTTRELIEYGVKSVLVEKPAGINISDILNLNKHCERTGATVYVAYNRRFYSSVSKAAEIIQEDGGVNSFNFEFTEWSNTIEGLKKDNEVKSNWFLANSTHVVDMAFFLGGKPEEISCYLGGKDRLKWHPISSVFSGAGITVNEALFSYQANWTAPGRWSLEILTSRHRLIFRPLETLKIQHLSSLEEKLYELDDNLDKKYKPGLYLQIKAFLDQDDSKLCHIKEHVEMLKIYSRIAGYK
jgi:predicted dehydrogenase